MALACGQVLEGKYVIARRIAEGATSTVYLGRHRRIGKDVAVKVLDPRVVCDPDMVDRFEREARIASSVRSSHVAHVYDFGELDTGERFMVMEYLEGESLARLLERERALAPRLIATIAAQILDALAAVHAAGIVHRDLKPENVIVTTRGKEGKDVMVKVIDFGISKVVTSDAPELDVSSGVRQLKETAAGAVLGTPLYMSPEQARGNTDQIDQRSDLFSLGVILYEAAAGEPPHTGENVNELLFRVALDEPVPLALKVPSVDPALAAIVTRAMAKDPARRYPTAEGMREAVDAWRAVFTSGMVAPVSLEGVATSVRPVRPSAVASGVRVAPSAPVAALTATPASVAVRPRARWIRWAWAASSVLALLVLGAPAARRALVARAEAPALESAEPASVESARRPEAARARLEPTEPLVHDPILDVVASPTIEPDFAMPPPARGPSISAAARPPASASARPHHRPLDRRLEHGFHDAGAAPRRAPRPLHGTSALPGMVDGLQSDPP